MLVVVADLAQQRGDARHLIAAAEWRVHLLTGTGVGQLRERGVAVRDGVGGHLEDLGLGRQLFLERVFLERDDLVARRLAEVVARAGHTGKNLAEGPHLRRRPEAVVRLGHQLGGLLDVSLDAVPAAAQRVAQRILCERRCGGQYQHHRHDRVLHRLFPSAIGYRLSTIGHRTAYRCSIGRNCCGYAGPM